MIYGHKQVHMLVAPHQKVNLSRFHYFILFYLISLKLRADFS